MLGNQTAADSTPSQVRETADRPSEAFVAKAKAQARDGWGLRVAFLSTGSLGQVQGWRSSPGWGPRPLLPAPPPRTQPLTPLRLPLPHSPIHLHTSYHGLTPRRAGQPGDVRVSAHKLTCHSHLVFPTSLRAGADRETRRLGGRGAGRGGGSSCRKEGRGHRPAGVA